MAVAPAPVPAAPASTTANVGMTNGLVVAGWDAVQSRTPTAKAPTCSSCARSGPRAPALRTCTSMPPAWVRVSSIVAATDPSRTASTAAVASPTGSNWNRASPPPASADSRALRKPSRTDTARSARPGSADVTATRVTVARSTRRTASGRSAMAIARPTSSRVEKTKARERTRSLYSRRATSQTLTPPRVRATGSSGPVGRSAGSITRRPPRRARARRRPPRPARARCRPPRPAWARCRPDWRVGGWRAGSPPAGAR